MPPKAHLARLASRASTSSLKRKNDESDSDDLNTSGLDDSNDDVPTQKRVKPADNRQHTAAKSNKHPSLVQAKARIQWLENIIKQQLPQINLAQGPQLDTGNEPGEAATKLYNQTMRNIEAKKQQLDSKLLGAHHASMDITAVTYAEAVQQHIPMVEKLAIMDTVLAFNLLMGISDAASNMDMDATKNMSSEIEDMLPVLDELDGMLVKLIKKRQEVRPAAKADSEGKRDGRMSSAVGIRYGSSREQREQATDEWASLALKNLEGSRENLVDYGLEHYFPQSIKALKQLCK